MAFSNYTPSPHPKNFGQPMQETQIGENNSGQGPNTPVPDIVAHKFNWAAFLLSWIWGLGNKTYITLIIFATILVAWIPIIGWLISLGICIWFGTKGNEWAWQNKRFQSIEHFHEYQKKWVIAGVVFYLICIVIGIIINGLFLAYLFASPTDNYENRIENVNKRAAQYETINNDSTADIESNLSKYENVNTDLSKYEKYYEHEMKKLNADLEKMQKDYEEEKRDYSEPIKDAKDYQERIEKWQKDYEEEKRDYEKQLAEEKELMEKVDAMLKDIKEKQNN